MLSKKVVNHIELAELYNVGNARRRDLINEPLEESAFLPKTVEYKDIDDAMKQLSESIEMVSEDGSVFPTFKLFSNQRFSEYSQSWNHVDKNNNLLLDFKTISRDNNPSNGSMLGRHYNIPGDRYFTVKKGVVLDKNGTESLKVLSMKQPMCVDLNYRLSIFTTKYQKLNEFNTKMNSLFKARQLYIKPNGYYMPITLDNVTDESEYNINDRQFYSQTYSLKLMAYILTENDFKVSEMPLKSKINLGMPMTKKTKASVEVNDCENEINGSNENPLVDIDIKFPPKVTDVEFDLDMTWKYNTYETVNIAGDFRIFVNDIECDIRNTFTVNDGDTIRIIVRHRNPLRESSIIMHGEEIV